MVKITFLRVEDNPTYFYRRRPGSSSQNFEVRNRIMASALNDMVSAYPPGVLCPQIAGIKDEHTRRRRYYEYLMRTFYRHAEGASGNCGRYFRAYGDYYRQKLLKLIGPAARPTQRFPAYAYRSDPDGSGAS